MRLPHLLIESPLFVFEHPAELIRALGEVLSDEEIRAIESLTLKGMPPVTSRKVLGTIIGINSGLLWSLENRPLKHYRSFKIAKGRGFRNIDAPRVALKVIQKWISIHFERWFTPDNHVYGFVRGRSHIHAAKEHLGAEWVFSVDIENFFPSTPQHLVEESLKEAGYPSEGASLIASLTCLRGGLAQGAPTSPVLSNICFRHMDTALEAVAVSCGARLTRYADDIVFSGRGHIPDGLEAAVRMLFSDAPWTLAEHKIESVKLPARLKVHGLLVHGDRIRLTKGYRNKVRAYRHCVATGRVKDDDRLALFGHIAYADFIEALS